MSVKLGFSGRWEGYRLEDLRKDFVAGVTVGVIAIPLGMAFAIASGVKPEYGLYTTIVAGFIIALFGGSRFQIGGPTGAFIPILLAIVLQYGYENLLIAGFLAGIMLVIMGITKMGAVIKYIPRPVTIGFTTGIAVIIFTGQIGNFFGLTELEQHPSFIANLKELYSQLPNIQWDSVATAVVSLVILIALPRFFPKVPASLVAIIVSTIFATLLFAGQVPTIGSQFGDIPGKLPSWQFPEITFERIVMLLGPAFTIALLGAIESLLSAVVADGMTGSRHNSNRELVGQGLANIVAPMVGGIPATGAIARTAANIKSGAVSPFSSIIHALTVIAILILFAPFASQIPLASMAPILMVVAWNMSSRRHFAQLLRMRNGDAAVTLITFLLTVFLNLTVAVGVGLVLAALLFIKRMSEMLVITKVLPDHEHERGKVSPMAAIAARDCPQFSIYTVDGPLFFGAAQYFLNTMLDAIQSTPRVLLIRLGKMPFIDATGEANLDALIRHFQANGSTVIISGLQHQPKQMLIRSGLYQRIGEENFFERTGEAINFALTLLDTNVCQACSKFAFRECADLKQKKTSGEE